MRKYNKNLSYPSRRLLPSLTASPHLPAMLRLPQYHQMDLIPLLYLSNPLIPPCGRLVSKLWISLAPQLPRRRSLPPSHAASVANRPSATAASHMPSGDHEEGALSPAVRSTEEPAVATSPTAAAKDSTTTPASRSIATTTPSTVTHAAANDSIAPKSHSMVDATPSANANADATATIQHPPQTVHQAAKMEQHLLVHCRER